MFYNPMELEIWRTCIAMAELKARRNDQTRDVKSPETLMWERLLRGVRRLFNVRLRLNFSPLRYAVQQK
jgi:hypothetical protein